MARLARRSTNRAKSRGLSAAGGVLPLLTQLGDLGGLTGDDLGPRLVLAQDPSLQDFRWPVGLAARQQPDDLDPRRQPARYPEHPHRHHRAVVAGPRVPRRGARSPPGGGSASLGSCRTSIFAWGCSARCWRSQSLSRSSSAGDDTDASTSASPSIVTSSRSSEESAAFVTTDPALGLPRGAALAGAFAVLLAAFLAGAFLAAFFAGVFLAGRLRDVTG